MDLDSLLKSIREENKGGAIVPAKFFGEDRYDKYYNELISEGRIEGENLSPDERKEGMKSYRKGKIDFETFVNKVLKTRDEIKKREQDILPESLTSAIVKRDSVDIEKFKPTSEGTQQNFDDILKGIDSILETLREENKLKKKESNKERLKDEERKRKKQENKLEKNPFKKLGGVVDRMLKPVKSMWEKIWNFIWNVFLGRTLMKLIDWFSDSENKGKLEAIGKFLEKTWPVLLAGYLLFGNSIGRLITSIVANTLKWTVKLGAIVAKQLIPLAKKLGLKKGLMLGGLAVGGAMLAGRMMDGGKDDVVGGENPAPVNSPVDDEEPKGVTKIAGQEYIEGQPMTPQQVQATQLSVDMGNPVTGQRLKDFQAGKDASKVKMEGGGMVPGSGPNKDTVPAMLAPGEFVMSRGAVEKYGTDTLSSMNAAGGGTNLPKRMEGITYASGGGMIGNKKEMGEKKEELSSQDKKEMEERKGGGLSDVVGAVKSFFGFGGNDKKEKEKEKEKEKTSAGGGGFSEDSLRKAMDDAGYTDKTERAMFLAQMAHESGNFRYDEEIASGEAYEGREDLGNTEPGDGVKYKGRGYIQLTGRANYEHYGNKLGVDLVGDPDLAKKPDIAAKVAVAYWNERVDRNAARAGDVRKVTYNINGGYNGLEDRTNKFRNYMKDPNYKVPSGGVISSGSSGSSGGGYSGGSSGGGYSGGSSGGGYSGGSSGGGSGGGYSNMKSSTVLARKSGVEGKLDKSTGKWTAGDWSKQERSRYIAVDERTKNSAPERSSFGGGRGGAAAYQRALGEYQKESNTKSTSTKNSAPERSSFGGGRGGAAAYQRALREYQKESNTKSTSTKNSASSLLDKYSSLESIVSETQRRQNLRRSAEVQTSQDMISLLQQDKEIENKRHTELMESTDSKKISDYDKKHGQGAYSQKLKEKLYRTYDTKASGQTQPTGQVVGRENLSPQAQEAIARLEDKKGLPSDMQYTKNGKKISAENFNRVKGMVGAAKEGGAKGVLNHMLSGTKNMFGGIFDKAQGAVNDPKSFVESMGGTVKDGNIGTLTAQEQKDFDTLAANKEKLKQSQQNLLGIKSPKKPQDDPLFAEYQEAFDNPKHPLHDKVAGDLFVDDKPGMRFADFKKLKAERSQAKLSPNQSPPPAPPEPPSQSQSSVSQISATQAKRNARRSTSSKKYSGEANSIGPKHSVPRDSSKAKMIGALV